jgi:nucleoside-diphosphate-sugar epimerase
MSKIAVLGGSGFIGSAIIDAALAQSGIDRITALQHRTTLGYGRQERLQVLEGSLSRLPSSVFAADVLYHAARQSSSNGRLGRLWQSFSGRRKNARLADQLAQAGLRTYYFSGSLMYGNSNEKIDECHPFNPISFAKVYQYAEQPFVSRSRCNTGTVLLRVPWVFGNGSWFRRFYLEPIFKKGHVPLYGSGNNFMTFIDRTDLANAALLLADYPPLAQANLFMDDYITQEEFASHLSNYYGLPIRRYTESEILKLGGSLLLEAFTSSIRLDTIHSSCRELLLKNRFKTVAQMLCQRLPEFSQEFL